MNKTLKLMCATLLTLSFSNDAFAMKRSALAVQEKPINPPLVSPILMPEIYQHHIFSNLNSTKDKNNASLVCKDWQKIIDEGTIILALRWKPEIQQEIVNCRVAQARDPHRNELMDISWLNLCISMNQTTDIFTGKLINLSVPTIKIPSQIFFANNDMFWTSRDVYVQQVINPFTDAWVDLTGEEILPFKDSGFISPLESLSKRFPNVQKLKGKLTNEILKYFTQLKTLYLNDNDKITDASVSLLTNLEFLELSGHGTITDDALKNLTNLKKLDLYSNDKITDASVSLLTKLEFLELGETKNITDEGLTTLTKLRILKLYDNDKITDASVSLLTNLENLELNCNKNISDDALKNLTNLKELNLKHNNKIMGDSFSRLTNLTKLDLTSNTCVTLAFDTFRHLTNLTDLRRLPYDQDPALLIEDPQPFWVLTNLKRLYIQSNTLTEEDFKPLTNLTDLSIQDEDYKIVYGERPNFG